MTQTTRSKDTRAFKLSFGKKNKTANSEKKGRTREFIAKLSKGLMLPIAMLPVAGLFLGIGATIATEAGNANLLALQTFGNFMKQAGDVIFGALPVLFAVAIAIAFTNDAGPAGLAALIGYLVFGGLQAALLQPVEIAGKLEGYNLLFYQDGSLGSISDGYGLPKSVVGSVLGITQLSTSVFGGFIIGFTVAWLYNKFKDIQLPAVIGFFNGVRFVPIVTFAALFPITLVVLMIWPLVGIGFGYIGEALGSNMYGFNSFIFGYIERALVPFGLHHAFYSPLWYSEVGGALALDDFAIVNGQFVTGVATTNAHATWGELAKSFNSSVDISQNPVGDQGVWAFVNSNLAGRNVTLTDGSTATIQFGDFTNTVYESAAHKLGVYDIKSSGVNIGQYMQGKYSFMMFGLPAAAAAMVMAAPKENRKMAGSIVISAGFTAMLTGITEPIEFTFLFLAPWLFWGFHAVMCAISFGLMNWIGYINPAAIAPHIGMTFSGGLLDWVIYGGARIPAGSNAWWALIFGVAYAPIYYFFFLWAIKRFNIATPGRGGNTQLFTKADFKAKQQGNGKHDPIAIEIINAYGGLENIKNVDACITKLRIQVANPKNVDENKLKNELGALGTIHPSAQSVYAIYGAKADYYKQQINSIIKEIKDDPSKKSEILNNSGFKPTAIESKKQTSKASSKPIFVYAPFDGKVIPLNKVPDETFSKKILGDGIAIIPESKDIYAIIDEGRISSVFPTGHAYSFEAKDGTQLLVHCGIDSVNIEGKDKKKLNPFKINCKEDDKVVEDKPIATIDLDILKKAKSNATPIIALNETLKGRKIVIKASGNVKKGELLFVIE